MFEYIYLNIFDPKMILVFSSLLGIVLLYLYATWTYDHWSKLGVPVPRTPVPLFGHAMSSMLGRVHLMEVMSDLYRKLDDKKFGGIYLMRSPELLIKDPELIGHILIKDFSHFTGRGIYGGIQYNPLNNNIFFTEGERWKLMRQKLSPTFTAAKLKHMNDQVKECSDNLMMNLEKTIDNDSNKIEIRNLMGNFSTDVIGSCAFGIKLDAINHPDSEFRKHGNAVFIPTLRIMFRTLIMFMQPALLDVFRSKQFQDATTTFFSETFKNTIEHREKHNVNRKDIVYYLMKAREDLVLNPNLKSEVIFTETEIVANAFILFTAGFETVSTSMSLCLYELALHKEIQDKVRKEIMEVRSKYNGEINSECINELHYLNMVIKETLRKYPPLLALNRIVSKPYLIPGTNIELKTGQKILIPLLAVHYDSKYYPDPHAFDPERFSEENVKNLHPNTYMPFGDGPRYCIGKRFAEFEMRMALSEMLFNYEVNPCDRTQIPMKFVIGTFINMPESVWLKFKKLNY